MIYKRPELFIKWVLSWLMLAVLLPEVTGRHIIGGDLQYECLGDGRYRITMKIYRDCRSQVGPVASFDGDGDGTAGAYIALYQGNNTFRLMNVYIVPLKSQSSIEAPDFPCLIPPNNLCVEQGIYELEIDLPEWPSASSYHLVLSALLSQHHDLKYCCAGRYRCHLSYRDHTASTSELQQLPCLQAIPTYGHLCRCRYRF